MILHVKGTEFTHHLTEEILLLTGQSTLLTDSIDHDAARQTLAFTVERSPVSSARTRFWRPAAVQYDRSARRATRVEVRNVLAVDVPRRDEVSREQRLVIELGLLVRGLEVHVSSVDEDRGRKAFTLTARLAAVDLRLTDADEVSPA